MTRSPLRCCTRIIRSSALVQASSSLSIGRTCAWPRRLPVTEMHFRHFRASFVYVYVSMYICMCMCMYIYIYICTCMYTCACVNVYMYMCMYICTSRCIFAESQHEFTGVVEHHACAGVYVRQMLWTSAYTFASRSLQDVHMRYIYTCIYAYVYIYIYVCM